MSRRSGSGQEPQWVWVARLGMQLVQVAFTVVWAILTK